MSDRMMCETCGEVYEWELKRQIARCPSCVSALESTSGYAARLIEMLAKRVLRLEGKKAGAQIQLNGDEMALVNRGELIQAIRALRGRIPMDLKEAKDIVDDYRWRR